MSGESNGWELFEKINYRAAEMAVRFYKGGQIALTKAVHKKLGADVREVELLYNKNSQKIGIRPAGEGSSNAIKLRKPKNQTSWIMSVAAFLKFYNLDELRTKKFPASYEGDMIVIDISKPME